MVVTSQYQHRLSSIMKFFSRHISQSDCNIHVKLNYIQMQRTFPNMRLGPSGPCIQCQCLSVSLIPTSMHDTTSCTTVCQRNATYWGGGGVGGLSATVSSTIKTCHHVITEMVLTVLAMAIHAHNTFNIRLAIRNKYMSQN